MLRLSDLFEILTEKNKLEGERVQLNTKLEELKCSNEPLYKKLAELDKQLAMDQSNYAQIVIELNKTNQFNAIDQLEDTFIQLQKYHHKKKEIDLLFNKLIVFLKLVEELHEYLLGMLRKQKKLSNLLHELKEDIQRYSKKIDVELLIRLCDELGFLFPYPLLHHDKNKTDPIQFFPDYENYLIQFYLLFYENKNNFLENNSEKEDLKKYIFMQIQLGFLYEKNAELLNDFFAHHYFSPAFLEKHGIKGYLNISQLLIEPIQYFPRFILILDTLLNTLKAFQLSNNINLEEMLSHVNKKINKLGKNFNKFLECRYPEEIHLFFLDKMITESLANNNGSLIEYQDISDLYIQQTLRTDRLRILENYIKNFFDYLKTYNEYRQRYFMYLFRSNVESIKLAEEWKNTSPEYVKIFNENRHKNEKPSLIFQEGILKLYKTAIRILINYNTPCLNVFSSYSLNNFIMAYILELEDTMTHLINNPDYVPNLATTKIEDQLHKVGINTIDRLSKYYYYESLHNMIIKTPTITAISARQT